MHERNLRVVADAEILAIRLQTISGGPPETLSVDLSPSRIVAIIIGTIVIFLLGSCLLNCGVSFYRNNPEFFNNFCKNTQSLVVDWYQAISDLFHAAYNDMMNQHSHGRNGFTLADQSDDEESNQNDVTRVEMVRYKDLASDRTQDKKQSSNPIYKDKKTEDI